MQKSKEKRKSEKPTRLTWSYILPPIVALLIALLPSIFSSRIINYLFSDNLIYPLAYIGSNLIFSSCFALLILILWISFRFIRFRQFIVELVLTIAIIIFNILMTGPVVLHSYKTSESLTIGNRNYYLREAVIHDYSDVWSERTGNYVLAHKCDSLSIFCETVFAKRTPLFVEDRLPSFREVKNQLLLVYVSNDTNDIEEFIAVIEENLESIP